MVNKFPYRIPKSDTALENSRTPCNHLLSVIKNVQRRPTYNQHFGFACPSPPATPRLSPLPHARSLRGCVRCGPLYVTGWPSTYRLEFLPFFAARNTISRDYDKKWSTRSTWTALQSSGGAWRGKFWEYRAHIRTRTQTKETDPWLYFTGAGSVSMSVQGNITNKSLVYVSTTVVVTSHPGFTVIFKIRNKETNTLEILMFRHLYLGKYLKVFMTQ